MGDLAPTFYYNQTWIVNLIEDLFSNCDGNMCSVLIKLLVSMFINLIFNYVYLEIGPIILDVIMVNCPQHENVYEFTPWILLAISKRKKWRVIQFAYTIYFMKSN